MTSNLQSQGKQRTPIPDIKYDFIIVADPNKIAIKPQNGPITVRPGIMNKYGNPKPQTFDVGFAM